MGFASEASLNFSLSPPPTRLNLPFCAGVQFSRDYIRAFNDRIRKYRTVNSLELLRGFCIHVFLTCIVIYRRLIPLWNLTMSFIAYVLLSKYCLPEDDPVNHFLQVNLHDSLKHD